MRDSAFFLGEFSPASIWGNLFGVGSGISFAVLVVALRYVKNIEPSAVIFYGNLLCFLASLPYLFSPYPSVSGWLSLLFLGIFQIGLAYIIYSWAVRYVTPLEGVIIPTIEPILNPLWVALVIGEVPSRWAILRGVIVISVVSFYCLRKAQN